jgi:hypothetical protein
MGRWSTGAELRRLTGLCGWHYVPLLLVRIRHDCGLICMSSVVEPGICGSTGVMDPCEPSWVAFTVKVFLQVSL